MQNQYIMPQKTHILIKLGSYINWKVLLVVLIYIKKPEIIRNTLRNLRKVFHNTNLAG